MIALCALMFLCSTANVRSEETNSMAETDARIAVPDPFVARGVGARTNEYYLLRVCFRDAEGRRRPNAVGVTRLLGFPDRQEVARRWTESSATTREIFASDGEPFTHSLWAPEMFWIDNRWFVYVCGTSPANVKNRQMVALAGPPGAEDPMADDFKLSFAGVLTSGGKWGEDGTVFRGTDGQLYFIWADDREDDGLALWISRMSSPTRLDGEPVCLLRATEPWERRGNWFNYGRPVIEGPAVLDDPATGTRHLFYSANPAGSDDYCIGHAVCEGADYLKPSSWRKTGVVCESERGCYGPGHCSFVEAKGRVWMLLHAGCHSHVRSCDFNDRYLRIRPVEMSVERPSVRLNDEMLQRRANQATH